MRVCGQCLAPATLYPLVPIGLEVVSLRAALNAEAREKSLACAGDQTPIAQWSSLVRHSTD
jgi:hypothetical protein